jgi:hypothetical protein
MLWPPSVMAAKPPQSPPEGVLVRMVLVTVTVSGPWLKMPPPLPRLGALLLAKVLLLTVS